ncbi:hypothetical protein GMYAFLOJ_CDS0034 [Microbacterium phage phiMiGM15]
MPFRRARRSSRGLPNEIQHSALIVSTANIRAQIYSR